MNSMESQYILRYYLKIIKIENDGNYNIDLAYVITIVH